MKNNKVSQEIKVILGLLEKSQNYIWLKKNGYTLGQKYLENNNPNIFFLFLCLLTATKHDLDKENILFDRFKWGEIKPDIYQYFGSSFFEIEEFWEEMSELIHNNQHTEIFLLANIAFMSAYCYTNPDLKKYDSFLRFFLINFNFIKDSDSIKNLNLWIMDFLYKYKVVSNSNYKQRELPLISSKKNLKKRNSPQVISKFSSYIFSERQPIPFEYIKLTNSFGSIAEKKVSQIRNKEITEYMLKNGAFENYQKYGIYQYLTHKLLTYDDNNLEIKEHHVIRICFIIIEPFTNSEIQQVDAIPLLLLERLVLFYPTLQRIKIKILKGNDIQGYEIFNHEFDFFEIPQKYRINTIFSSDNNFLNSFLTWSGCRQKEDPTKKISLKEGIKKIDSLCYAFSSAREFGLTYEHYKLLEKLKKIRGSIVIGHTSIVFGTLFGQKHNEYQGMLSNDKFEDIQDQASQIKNINKVKQPFSHILDKLVNEIASYTRN